VLRVLREEHPARRAPPQLPNQPVPPGHCREHRQRRWRLGE
jgi:hypothetical protein